VTEAWWGEATDEPSSAREDARPTGLQFSGYIMDFSSSKFPRRAAHETLHGINRFHWFQNADTVRLMADGGFRICG